MNFQFLSSMRSSEYNDSMQMGGKNGGPNNFCLNIFAQKSYEDSNYFNQPLEPFMNNRSLEPTPSQYMRSSGLDMKLPSFDLSQFIKKEMKEEEIPKKETSLGSTVVKKTRGGPHLPPNIRDYKKNICRNILRHAIRSMGFGEQYVYICKLMERDVKKVSEFIQYYGSKMEFISGFRVLKKHLLVMDKSESERKLLFKQYLIWFIEKRASLYIMQSEANNLKEYLSYKNDVLLYYLHRPEVWYSNKPLWKIQRKSSKKVKKTKKQQITI